NIMNGTDLTIKGISEIKGISDRSWIVPTEARLKALSLHHRVSRLVAKGRRNRSPGARFLCPACSNHK
ncbi:hypothetical protein, partial [Acinetobacter baumannii]|uniref:hypothetical protein n=1 Tax=Acinetobacter baumannii TaxID=470 RepID=UPI001BB46C45